jgi:hypothetical protein
MRCKKLTAPQRAPPTARLTEIHFFPDPQRSHFRRRRVAVDARPGSGVARGDANFTDVGRMVGLAAIRSTDPEQVERTFGMSLDGLRYDRAGVEQEVHERA